jgi:hypothetical protein
MRTCGIAFVLIASYALPREMRSAFAASWTVRTSGNSGIDCYRLEEFCGRAFE